jgi:Protein of unknwon function (DUF3310)
MTKLKICNHGTRKGMFCTECADEFSANFHLGAEGDKIKDMINSPSHYIDGGIEAIDYIEAKLTPEQFQGMCLGNALKYLSRYGRKDDTLQEVGKAIYYLNRLQGSLQKHRQPSHTSLASPEL